MFWEGYDEAASQQPCLFLPEPSACCHVGSPISVHLLLIRMRAHTQYPASVS